VDGLDCDASVVPRQLTLPDQNSYEIRIVASSQILVR